MQILTVNIHTTATLLPATPWIALILYCVLSLNIINPRTTLNLFRLASKIIQTDRAEELFLKIYFISYNILYQNQNSIPTCFIF